MFEKITGHQKQIELLTKAIERGKLAHGYVFAGPEGVGKKTVAKFLAQRLLDQTTDFHPDYLEVSGDDGIKIETVRELTYKLSLKPYQAKNKVAVIDNAHDMTTEAANALLKVLEEPKAYNFIFLITSNANKLPKTILSRCQKINFGPVDLQREATEESVIADEYFETFMNSSSADRLIAAYEIAERETHEIKKILEAWIMKLETLLLENPQKALARKIYQLSTSRRYLEQNVNVKLLLTNLMLNTQ